MQIQPIRNWLTTSHLYGLYRYWPVLCRFPFRAFRRGFFLLPFQPDFITGRDESLILHADLLELLGIGPADLGLLPQQEPPRLDLQWPSDETPPLRHFMTPTIEQTIRPWPPELVLGSLVDLLT